MKWAVLLVFLVGATIVAAQTSEIVVDEDCTTAAQEWYDLLEPTERLLQTQFTEGLSASRTERRRLADEYETILEVTASLDAPDCAAYAKDAYLDAIEVFASTLETESNDVFEYLVVTYRGTQLVGEMRGYLVALGVSVITPPGRDFAFR